MNEKPETIWVTKAVLGVGKIEKVLAYPIPTTPDYIGASGRWKHIRIDSYYIQKTEEAAVKFGRASIKYQIESNAARNKVLETYDCAVLDATDDEIIPIKHAAE